MSGLSKAFNRGRVQAVRQVNFAAADGRITALLGPNGAGKSTTLRILATVMQPDAGEARIGGVSVQQDPMAVRRLIGVLPHDAGLYGRLTAVENIRYFGTLHGLPRAELERRIDGLVERLDMAAFAGRRVAGFSQGQRIKVALARALIHDPAHVMLDEPTNGLDVMATRSLRQIILQLKAEGRCVLFSSHVMQEVSALCDELVIIGQGEVRFQGTVEDLARDTGLDDLEDAFVARAEGGPA